MKKTPKLISYTIVDPLFETHMELGTRFFEEKASEFFYKTEKKGLLRWRMNRVWNKQGNFTISQVNEYRDEKAFVACQTLLDKYHAPQVKTFVNKVVGSRGIVLHEFTSEDFN